MKNLNRYTEPDNYIDQSGRLIKLKWFALIAAVGIALLFFLSGCNDHIENKRVSREIIYDAGLKIISVLTVDSCEYIVLGSGRKLVMSHKGDCKYCIQRKGDVIK